MDLIIGPHINREKSFEKSIEDMKKNIKSRTSVDITAMAMFIAGPRTYKINITEDDINYFQNNNNLQVFVHNTYLTSPWKGQLNTIKSLISQLDKCSLINAKGFIIHLPKEKDIENIIEQLSKLINYESNVIIYLEIPAISKSSNYHLTDNINELFDTIKNNLDPLETKFGLCVDTAHLWSCGVDVSDYCNTIDWLNELTVKNVMFHLNDNVKPLGKAPDEHIALTEGEIWKKFTGSKKNSGINAVITYAKQNNCPIILERKLTNSFYNDYKIINEILKE